VGHIDVCVKSMFDKIDLKEINLLIAKYNPLNQLSSYNFPVFSQVSTEHKRYLILFEEMYTTAIMSNTKTKFRYVKKLESETLVLYKDPTFTLFMSIDPYASNNDLSTICKNVLKDLTIEENSAFITKYS